MIRNQVGRAVVSQFGFLPRRHGDTERANGLGKTCSLEGVLGASFSPGLRASVVKEQDENTTG